MLMPKAISATVCEIQSGIFVSYMPEQRQRHVMPGRWEEGTASEPSEDSLFHKLLSGCFKDDPDADEKIALLQEVTGCAASGHGTRLKAPKAVTLLGPGAQNGKGQILDVMRGVLPPSACCSVSPSEFGDQHARIELKGKLLNTSDELGTSHAITSDKFKSTVTGDPIAGRGLFRNRMTFRPEAQHVFAANDLPSFAGGMDSGVRRRLMVVEFHRTIPDGEQIADIGQRIAAEEPDLLLAWAVEGAARVIQRGRVRGALKRDGVEYYVGGSRRGFFGMLLRGGRSASAMEAAGAALIDRANEKRKREARGRH